MGKWKLICISAFLIACFARAAAAEAPIQLKNRDYQIENKYEFYHLQAAYALKTGDLTVCNTCIDRNNMNECIGRARSNTILHNIAKGDCSQIDTEPYVSLCKAVNAGCEKAENGSIRKLCEGMKSEDIQKIIEATWMPFWAFRASVVDAEGAREFLAYYRCFQGFDSGSCKDVDSIKYLSKDDPLYPVNLKVFEILQSPALSASEFVALHEGLLEQYKNVEPKQE